MLQRVTITPISFQGYYSVVCHEKALPEFVIKVSNDDMIKMAA